MAASTCPGTNGRSTEPLLASLHNPSDERKSVEGYPRYFLGSIVVCNRNGNRYIIDGQQRLTTLTLLLIYLHVMQEDKPDIVDVTPMIFSKKFGHKSFNLEIPERTVIFNSLFNAESIDGSDRGLSAQNILDRYQDIVELF
ncbi:MAG: DUF262 domain-containing protein [Ardenticatenales bacterium]|nr:DUF262 domain-containing protein [Ardenticatenales bacterium]